MKGCYFFDSCIALILFCLIFIVTLYCFTCYLQYNNLNKIKRRQFKVIDSLRTAHPHMTSLTMAANYYEAVCIYHILCIYSAPVWFHKQKCVR